MRPGELVIAMIEWSEQNSHGIKTADARDGATTSGGDADLVGKPLYAAIDFRQLRRRNPPSSPQRPQFAAGTGDDDVSRLKGAGKIARSEPQHRCNDRRNGFSICRVLWLVLQFHLRHDGAVDRFFASISQTKPGILDQARASESPQMEVQGVGRTV